MDVVRTSPYPLVIKADGLALGKGVEIVDSFEEACASLDRMLHQRTFGDSGATVVMEEFLAGEELSLLCLVSHNRLIPLDLARDYKKAYKGDTGPNTGGVGAYSPYRVSPELHSSLDDMCTQISAGLEADGYDYTGILFIGVMVVDGVPKVLGFNVRFGDLETEVLLARLTSDLAELLLSTIDGTVQEKDITWSEDFVVAVILTSLGYPGSYTKDEPITLPSSLRDGELLFHNGTSMVKKEVFDGSGTPTLVNSGGRVLTAMGKASTQAQARNIAYNLVSRIHCPALTYRTDIATSVD
ncbi:phosphoribosylamine--glycine ligase [Actinotignum urinale]|uniref:phosphoribosylamine--glycine ligase n=1 Tax=Actinotignum urinale TaxID=190146 RepID=UPI00370D47BA